MGEPVLTELLRLVDQRNVAAYRSVAAVELAIHYLETGHSDWALTTLKRSYYEFQDANDRVSNFYEIHKGELIRHAV